MEFNTKIKSNKKNCFKRINKKLKANEILFSVCLCLINQNNKNIQINK